MTPVYILRAPERINLHDTETFRDHLSHSSLKTFLACQQQYAWHYEHRLEPAITKQPLMMGRAFAYALEATSPHAGWLEIQHQAKQERERAAGNPWIAAPDQRDVDTAATVVKEAARCYLKHFGAHTETREVEFRARIRNPERGGRYSQTHDLVGRLDAVSPDYKVMYEDKLVGQIPRSSFAARVRLDRQVSIGAYLIWRTTGVTVEEVRYRMTLKPAIRQKQNETSDEYLARIAEEYATRPDHYLAEEVATRTEDDFLRLEQELWEWAEQVRRARAKGVWPRNTGACHEFGGCRFLPLCAREPGAGHQFVEREQRVPEEVAA